MTTRMTILIPVALGLMASACTTTTTSTSQDQGTKQIEGEATTADLAEYRSKLAETNRDNQQEIAALKKALANNDAQLVDLHTALDKKDSAIALLESGEADAESLLALAKERRLRNSLESQYAELKVENDHLVDQIKALESKRKTRQMDSSSESVFASSSQHFLDLNNSFQTLDSEHYALNQAYQSLIKKQAGLQEKYAALSNENQTNQQSLAFLQQENRRLAEQISAARSQNQILWTKVHSQRETIDGLQKGTTSSVDQASLDSRDTGQLHSDIIKLSGVIEAQKTLIADYQDEMAGLEASLQKGAADKAKLKALEARLSTLSKLNLAADRQLAKSRSMLVNQQQEQARLADSLAQSKAQQATLQQRLDAIELRAKNSESQRVALESQVNGLIPFQAEVNALQAQIDSGLSNVRWQIPNEMSLHNTFEILVTATVDKPVAGQTYVAELVTDSAIQMVSASEAEAVIQNGQLQWRWRVNGLNERPKATLNLFISQQMNYQGQRIMRQIYRDSDTLALTNNNLLDKYGYWGMAILVGLLGGFLVGRVNRKDKNS